MKKVLEQQQKNSNAVIKHDLFDPSVSLPVIMQFAVLKAVQKIVGWMQLILKEMEVCTKKYFVKGFEIDQ